MENLVKYKSVSKPKPYKDSRGKYNWVVYYRNPEKDIRSKKLFVYEFEAQDFYDEIYLSEQRLGMQANHISFEDKRDLLEAMRVLEGYDITLLELANLYAKTTDDLKQYNTSLLQVIEDYKKIHKERELSVSILRAVEVYVNLKLKEEIAKNHQTHIETTLYKLVEAFGKKTMLSDITAMQIENWLNSIKLMKLVDSPDELIDGRPKRIYVESKKAISAETKNGHRRMLYTFFKFCKMRNWVKENPIERIAPTKIKAKTPTIFTLSETANMLHKTESLSDIRTFLAIGSFAGLRVSEIQRLTWDKIKFDDREIVLDAEKTKTSARRVVKITENLANWLTPYSEHFSTKDKVLNKGFIARFKKFRETNKIKWKDNALRHSAATYYLALTKNAYLTAEQMGHSVDVLKKHYNGLAREKEAIAYFNITPKD